jgi:hypothetical protein
MGGSHPRKHHNTGHVTAASRRKRTFHYLYDENRMEANNVSHAEHKSRQRITSVRIDEAARVASSPFLGSVGSCSASYLHPAYPTPSETGRRERGRWHHPRHVGVARVPPARHSPVASTGRARVRPLTQPTRAQVERGGRARCCFSASRFVVVVQPVAM